MAKPQKILIGVDEAGYGPNLGPLVIGMTVWRAPKSLSESELGEEFAKFSRPDAWKAGCPYVPLGDSKQLYQPPSGLASLEIGLLAMLAATGHQTSDLCQFVHDYARIEHCQLSAAPWYDTLRQNPIPRDSAVDEIARLGQIATQSLQSVGVELVGAKGLIVPESSFNHAVGQLGSKGLVLSRKTLSLVAEAVQEVDEDAEIYCDRQGGRKNYLPVLLDAMPDEWFDETATGNQRSSYRNRGTRSLEIHFSVRGDQFPPTALASMLAKYLRESLMHSFNDFWREHLPELKPTAGYPVDAQRFRAEIEAAALGLGLAEETWWRCR